MTEKQLKEIKILDLEIKRMKNLVSEIGKMVDEKDIKKTYLQKLECYQEELIKKKIEAEEYIQKIDNAELRLILQMRYIDLKSWNEIARTLNYDRSTLFYKCKNHFYKQSQKSKQISKNSTQKNNII